MDSDKRTAVSVSLCFALSSSSLEALKYIIIEAVIDVMMTMTVNTNISLVLKFKIPHTCKHIKYYRLQDAGFRGFRGRKLYCNTVTTNKPARNIFLKFILP